ncbi:MAG: PilZ domain-containing protein [Candidatus Alcyoniella australis]|nr:PilZ domain-containing protein [Candidatus Alcyoniella australis]
MDQREHRRVFKALLAKINYSGGECFGYVHNLSKTGFGITTDHNIPMASEVLIDVKMPPKRIIRTGGRVVWQRTLPPGSPNGYMVGVKLVLAPPEYSEFIEELIKKEDELLSVVSGNKKGPN